MAMDPISERGTSGARPPNQATVTGAGWSAIEDAAATVAMIAGIPREQSDPRTRQLASAMRDAPAWQQAMAMDRIDDISAMLRPGLAALLAVNARGQSPVAPAQTLWQEYVAARDALLALIPERGGMGPRRSA